MQKWLRVVLIVGFLLLAGGSAGATPVTLSSLSSDATPASALNGVYDFDVTGDTLRLTVTNSSQFDIVSIFFNDTNDIASIDFVGVEGSSEPWVFRDDGKFLNTAPFGSFDYALFTPVWKDSAMEGVGPGDVVTFLFDIDCAGSLVCDANDFATATSFGGPASVNVAGRFIRGPEGTTNPFGGGTQVGGQVPEPGTALLLGGGLLALALRRRF